MTRPGRRARRDEAGHVIGAAIVVPVLLASAGVAIAFGRGSTAEGAIGGAAEAAARQASIARSASTAEAEAYEAAQASLASQDLDCSSLSVSIDVDGFSTPVGQAAQVSATVTCTVGLSDLGWVPGLPGSKTFTASAESALDTYRERTL